MKLILQAAAMLSLCVALSIFTLSTDLVQEIEAAALPVMGSSEQTEESSSRPMYQPSAEVFAPASSEESRREPPHPIRDREESASSEEETSPPAFETAPPVPPTTPPPASQVESSTPASSKPPVSSSTPSSGPPAVVVDPSSAESSSVSGSTPSSQPSSSTPGSSSAPASEPSSAPSTPSSEPSREPSSEISSEPSSESSSEPSSQPDSGTVWVTMNGKTSQMDAFEAVCMVTEAEVGYTFHKEAIKAQAVAAYTYIQYYNAAGSPASVPGKTATETVKKAVAEVFGQAVYYGGKYAFTPYSACSAGKTAASAEVWGGHYSYLVSVDSAHDPIARHKNSTVTYSQRDLKALLEDYTGLTLDDDSPEDWLRIDETAAGGYVLKITVTGVDGEKQLTGRKIRENLLSYKLKSHAFTVDYADGVFTFTTNGYGHGVGLSQTGANGYAVNDGWSYIEILEHYYPGTSVQ